MSISSTNLSVGNKSACGSLIKRKWNGVKKAISHCNPKELIYNIAPRVAFNTTAMFFGSAAAQSVSAHDPWKPLSTTVCFSGIGHLIAGVVEGAIGLERDTKGTTLKGAGDILSGFGMIAAASGVGPLSMIPIISGVALNITGAFMSMQDNNYR